MKKIIFIVLAAFLAVFLLKELNTFNLREFLGKYTGKESKKVVTEEPSAPLPPIDTSSQEAIIVSVIENSLPSVVTIGIKKTTVTRPRIEIDPFDIFGEPRIRPGQKRNIEQNIGSGFIIAKNGLIVTNKHVVADTEATYTVLTNDKKILQVEQIYRDPLNDLAILKVNANDLKAIPLGNSDNLKLGQTVIAIGTPLGDFTNSVTTGIISGLGRGITAGSPFEGSVEKLDNVIQTDAAINPGNSGGPLLNSRGEVIGVNTAVSAEGQNIGFAIPVNIVKDLIDTFNKRGGTFERPYLGVRYEMVDRKTAVQNKLVEGAFIVEVLEGSPAQKAGLQEEDIITKIDNTQITGADSTSLAKIIAEKKVGDWVVVTVWRNGEFMEKRVTLEKGE